MVLYKHEANEFLSSSLRVCTLRYCNEAFMLRIDSNLILNENGMIQTVREPLCTGLLGYLNIRTNACVLTLKYGEK